jgi:hypothetical protein
VADQETWLFNLRTGDLIRRVFPSEHGWSTDLLGNGTSDAVWKTDDEERPVTNVAATFRPNARGLAVIAGGTVLYAGKIETYSHALDAQTLTVSTVEIRIETMWRLTYGVNQYENGTLTITNRSASGAVRAILARMMQWSAEWALPIDLPADGSGTISQTWEFWRKLRISDLLQQIEEEGFEVYFRPYLAGDQVRFQAVVASKIILGRTKFILQAPEIPIDHITYTVDGSSEVTGVQGLGDGMEQDQKVAWAGSTAGQDIIVRDTKKEYPDLVGDRLAAATEAGLREDQDPLAQWSIGQFHVSEEWSPEHALPARGWSIYSQGEPVIPDGTHELRVISAKGKTTSRIIEVEVQRAA